VYLNKHSVFGTLMLARMPVDQGTAFDIAGNGIAGSVSMEEAIKLAANYSKKFRHLSNNTF
jgi:4-phospho-D-threonate 3-dehydrogenase / 4-phospho-D-erythronate 3-dehydrogenase